MTDIAPILLFVYNRPWHTRQTLEALSRNELAAQSLLYVCCDGPKQHESPANIEKINETRRVIKEKQWTKSIIIHERESNLGLANSVIQGVTEVINKHDKVIVMEDDLVTSKGFLTYMNNALTFYETVEQVMHISGYWFPVKQEGDTSLPNTFFYRSASCWGWGTWKRAWDKLETDPHLLKEKILQLPGGKRQFNIENSSDHFSQLEHNILGKINTWAVKWYATVFLNKGLCLHPNISLVNNIGFDNTGANCRSSESGQYYWDTLADHVPVSKIKLSESRLAVSSIKQFYRKNSTTMIHQLKRVLPPGLKHFIKENVLSKVLYNNKSYAHLKYFPRYKETSVTLMGKTIRIMDSASFLFMYKEIFEKELFKFNTSHGTPYIIDGGANIGLATLYFKRLYPNAKVVAFEPDPTIFKILGNNLAAFDLKDVTLINKALSDKASYVNFYSEGADAGRIDNVSENGEKRIKVPTLSLRDYLNKEEVHFLKLDIEGAEIDVLNDIKDHLQNVRMLFVEYHSFANKSQRLDELINILASNNFRIYINAPGLSPSNPFLDIPINFDMDMQLNIYAIRK